MILSSAAADAPAGGSGVPGKVLDADPSEFQRLFNRQPFAIGHSLAASGLFTLESLERATEALIKAGKGFRVHVRDAQKGLDTHFDDIPTRQRTPTMFRELEAANAWIRLNDVGDVDRRYEDLIHAVVDEICTLAGRSQVGRVTQAQFSVFVSSPHSVTPYHIDHESNFLCQISGEKDVCVFCPDDREVLSEVEIERFYTGELNAAPLRDGMESHGNIFHLSPGVGVHHPPLAGHWVKNGPEVSISVSINLCMRDIDRRAHVYQVNHLLRKLGTTPTPPGRSRMLDALKAGVLEAAGTSRPKSTSDIVFSGLRRLRAPFRLGRYMRRRFHRHAPQS